MISDFWFIQKQLIFVEEIDQYNVIFGTIQKCERHSLGFQLLAEPVFGALLSSARTYTVTPYQVTVNQMGCKVSIVDK